MEVESKSLRKKSKLPVFIITPVIFVVVGYFLIYTVMSSLIGSPAGWLNVLLLNDEPQFTDHLNNVFTPPVAQEQQETVDAKSITFPHYESIYGEIECTAIDLKVPLIFGDSIKALAQGGGQYNGSFIPGFGGQILVGGHSTTHFKNLQHIALNDIITVRTSYGTYTYQVSDIKILKATDSSAYSLALDREQLVLYSCYPFGVIGTSNRFFVYADYLSGPKITGIYEGAE